MFLVCVPYMHKKYSIIVNYFGNIDTIVDPGLTINRGDLIVHSLKPQHIILFLNHSLIPLTNSQYP